MPNLQRHSGLDPEASNHWILFGVLPNPKPLTQGVLDPGSEAGMTA